MVSSNKQAKPDAGKLIIATVALLIASTSSLLVVRHSPCLCYRSRFNHLGRQKQEHCAVNLDELTSFCHYKFSDKKFLVVYLYVIFC